MASLHPEQPKVLLPDDIWIARQHKLSHLASFVSSSFHASIDSQIYSTLDDIDATALFSDEDPTDAIKPNQKSNKQKKIHFQDPLEQASTKSKIRVQPAPPSDHDNKTFKLKSIRSAIDSLGDHQPITATSTSFISRRPDLEQQVEAYLRDQSQHGEHHDSFTSDLNNFIRIASENTKKMFRKIKVPDLTSKKLWRRNHAETTEGVSSESLSSAGPSGRYHLPQDMSPVSNRSPDSAASGDMDTPFSAGIEQTRALDSHRRHDESQDGHGLQRRMPSGALKYVQKWKVASRIGALIPNSRTHNDSPDIDDGETAWNSTTGDRSATREESSIRRRLARSLSF